MSGIISLPEVFTPEHVPCKLNGREEHVEKLLGCLAPTVQRQRPLNVWVTGKTGSGKSALVRLALLKHYTKYGVRFSHVNCFRARTTYAVLEHILNDLRVLRAEVPQTEFKARKLAEALRGLPLVVALDEIDRMPEAERESIIHILSEMSGVGLVCVSEDKDAVACLQKCTANRLSPVLLELGPYGHDALLEILADRSEVGLQPGSWSRNVLEKIAAMSGGDARVAIQTLRTAAHLADGEFSGFIEERHVDEGFSRAQGIRRDYKLRKLSLHHRIIYDIVKERGSARLGEVADEFRKRCAAQKVEPVSSRSFYRYAETLRYLRLVRGERIRAFGGHSRLEVVE
jgi:cell division control protein 6